MKKRLLFVMAFLAFAWTGCRDVDYDTSQADGASDLSTKAEVVPANTPTYEQLADIFDVNKTPTFTLIIPLENWNTLLKAFDENLGVDRNAWVTGRLKYEKDGTTTEFNTGLEVRLRGTTSRRRPEVGSHGSLHQHKNTQWQQTNFALRFRDQTFHGLTRLRINSIYEDPTRIRELYSFDLNTANGVWTTPRMSYCKLYVQVEGSQWTAPVFYGLYGMMEELNQQYVTARKGAGRFGDDQGFLWEANFGASLHASTAYPKFMGDDPANELYELSTNTGRRAEAQAQLIRFITDLNDKEGTPLEIWARQTMDLEFFFKTYAGNVIVGNWDDYWVNSNNYRMYFNSQGKFFFIHDDFDGTLGTALIIDPGKQDIFNWSGGANNNVLVRKLIWASPTTNSLYLTQFRNLKGGLFAAQTSIDRIRGWHRTLVEPNLWNETVQYTEPDQQFGDRSPWWSAHQQYRLWDGGTGNPNNFFVVRAANIP